MDRPHHKESGMSNERPILLCEDHLEYSKAFKWLMRRTELNSNDKIVYTRLRNCTFEFGEYWVSQDYLSHECGFSVDTVQRSLKKLEKFGLISKTQHGKKMFNSYQCHIHEWMTDENKYSEGERSKCPITKSETANTRITQSDTADPRMVTPQDRGSIYKEQSKRTDINIADFEVSGSEESPPSESLGEYRWRKWQEIYPDCNTKSRCLPILQRMGKREFDELMEGTKHYIELLALERQNGFPTKRPQYATTFLRGKTHKEAKKSLEQEKLKCTDSSDLIDFKI
jgi:hypothetical protein